MYIFDDLLCCKSYCEHLLLQYSVEKKKTQQIIDTIYLYTIRANNL